jgi:alanine racemase
LGYWIHEKQSVQELAKKLNTIPYEIVCGVGCRIQRVWVP